MIYKPRKAKVTSLKTMTTKPFMLMSNEEFIEFLGPIAQKDYHKSGRLASVTIAQAMHESFSGCSLLAQKGNNLFDMKAYLLGNNWKGSTWKGKVVVKIIKSPNAWCIANHKAGKDGVKMVLFKSRSPGSQGSNFELHGKQIGSQHVRRKPWFRTEYGISILHDQIHR